MEQLQFYAYGKANSLIDEHGSKEFIDKVTKEYNIEAVMKQKGRLRREKKEIK